MKRVGGIIRSMVQKFGSVSWRQRLAPWFSGFDGPLAFAVFMLACAGMLTMYSSGWDHGTRFEDHGRNMLIAATIMFFVAQIPPQRLMTLVQCGCHHSAQRSSEDRHALDAGLVVSKARRPDATAGLWRGGGAAGHAGGAGHQAARPGHRLADSGGGSVGDLLCRHELETGYPAGDSGRGWHHPDRAVRAPTVRRRRALAGAARLPANIFAN